MSQGSIGRSTVVWLVVAVLLGAYAFWLSGQLDDARTQAQAAQQRERQLVEQIQMLASRTTTVQPSSHPLADDLARALLRRPDLIPFEPVMGGTFYFLEDSIQVLSERHVQVVAEDGHIRGEVLLSFAVGADGAYEFTVLDSRLD